MDTELQSSILLENVNKLLITFIPAQNRRDINSLYTSLGVRSHGTINCMKIELRIFFFLSFIFIFKFLIINRIVRNLFGYHLMHLLRMLKNYFFDNGVVE